MKIRAVAVDVAEAAADDEERGEGQGVARHDPLDGSERGVELPDDGRDRHVQDGGVEHDDERRHEDDDQRDPARPIRRRDVGSVRGFMVIKLPVECVN